MRQEPLTLSKAIELADLLGINLPTTDAELKSAYRRASMKYHPDREGGDEEMSKAVNVAYQRLTGIDSILLSGVYSDAGDLTETQTTSGEDIHTLGLGLGSTQNGKDCPTCKHAGYTTYHQLKFGKCPRCDHSSTHWAKGSWGWGTTIEVPVEYPCRACNATGKFTQVHTKKIVDCLVCKGTKMFKTTRLELCPDCMGTGSNRMKTEQAEHHTCWECKGSGEIPISNPVLSKGRLMNFKEKKGA
jgi:hypothetical protein